MKVKNIVANMTLISKTTQEPVIVLNDNPVGKQNWILVGDIGANTIRYVRASRLRKSRMVLGRAPEHFFAYATEAMRLGNIPNL